MTERETRRGQNDRSRGTWKPAIIKEPRKEAVWSDEQQAVFEMLGQHGNVLVQCYAGTGKTTVATEMCWRIMDMVAAGDLPSTTSVLFLAFNKSIQKTLERRIPDGAMAYTTHALGLQAVTRAYGRCDIDEDKYRALCKELVVSLVADCVLGLRPYDAGLEPHAVERLRSTVEATDGSGGDRVSISDLSYTLLKMTEMAMATLTDPTSHDALWEMVMQRDIFVDPDDFECLWPLVGEVVRIGHQMVTGEGHAAWVRRNGQPKRVIGFIDMIYEPVAYKLQVRPFDFVFGDEAQDWNACQQKLAMRSVKWNTGRLIVFGDRYQSIYGWAGADTQGLDTLKRIMKMSELGVKQTRRVPHTHIEHVQQVVSDFAAHPDNAQGRIEQDVSEEDFFARVRRGDVVLYRLNRVGARLCLRGLRQGLPWVMRGSDIGTGLVSIVNKVQKAKGGKAFSSFPTKLAEYEQQMCQALYKPDSTASENAILALKDKCATIRVILEQTTPAVTTYDGLKAAIQALFTDADDRKAVVTGSTVHRFKGDENPTVWIVAPHLFYGKLDRSVEQKQQARNVDYVARTRSTDYLGIVMTDD